MFHPCCKHKYCEKPSILEKLILYESKIQQDQLCIKISRCLEVNDLQDAKTLVMSSSGLDSTRAGWIDAID